MPAHHRFGHYYMGYLDWNTPAAIEVVSGAFCMLRREALDKVGLLDEDFFMYGEDIDLSYRVLKGGYRNYYLPSLILHYKGESTQKSSFRYVHVFYEAMLIFFRKHNSGMSLLLTVPISAAIYARASVAAFGMLLSKLRKSLGFTPRREASPRYLFLGSQQMLDAVVLSVWRTDSMLSSSWQMRRLCPMDICRFLFRRCCRVWASRWSISFTMPIPTTISASSVSSCSSRSASGG